MDIVDIKIEEHLEKRLTVLLDRRMEDIINEVVKRAIPELTYQIDQGSPLVLFQVSNNKNK